MESEESMATEPYQVRLDEIFEGPLDLLVHLIKKNEVDIYDIPIALITEQYLQYLDWMKSMNIEFAGDFIVMASTLTQIKSRMLLPVHDDEEPEEDPRQEITRPLLEYLRMKSAADQLAERNLLGEKTFIRSPDRRSFMADDEEGFVKIGLFELIDAYVKAIPAGYYTISADDLNIALIENPPYLIDVRTDGEVANGVIAGSIHVSLRTLMEQVEQWPEDLSQPTVVYCSGGHRSVIAMVAMQLMGYEDVHSLAGGMQAWLAKEYPVGTQ